MIGTLRESSLHAALKLWAAQPGDAFEVEVEGYFIDIARADTLLEIQTRNFAAMRRKLRTLVEGHPVCLIHPIAQEKYVVQLANAKAQTPTKRRKSPRRGRVEDIFRELVSVPELMAHPNFSLMVVLTREEEIQTRGKGGSWRRKGWKIIDRKLLEVVGVARFAGPQDFLGFLPEGLMEPFTTSQLAKAGKYQLDMAQKITYCLRRMGAIAAVGKQGSAILYATTTHSH